MPSVIVEGAGWIAASVSFGSAVGSCSYLGGGSILEGCNYYYSGICRLCHLGSWTGVYFNYFGIIGCGAAHLYFSTACGGTTGSCCCYYRISAIDRLPFGST